MQPSNSVYDDDKEDEHKLYGNHDNLNVSPEQRKAESDEWEKRLHDGPDHLGNNRPIRQNPKAMQEQGNKSNFDRGLPKAMAGKKPGNHDNLNVSPEQRKAESDEWEKRLHDSPDLTNNRPLSDLPPDAMKNKDKGSGANYQLPKKADASDQADSSKSSPSQAVSQNQLASYDRTPNIYATHRKKITQESMKISI